MPSLAGCAGALLILASLLAPAGCNRQNKAEQDRQPATALSVHATPKGLPTLAPMLARVSPAVVNISVQGTIQVQNPPGQNPRPGQFFGLSQKPHTERFQAVGSGVIIDAVQGYVVTNNHVVKNAQRIQLTLSDRRERQAKLVGADPQSDIAILKLDADSLKDIPLGTSSDLRVGDYVIAIGDPYGIGQTTTFGIVSALGRTDLGIENYEDFIQTDASINPGNSGGALVNMAGQLVGMNTAIYSGSGGSVGVGFAIPVDMVRTIARELIQSGKVSRGSLGVTVQDLTPELARAIDSRISAGALVSQVKPDSPGAKAGIKYGDVIMRMNDIVIVSSNDLRNRVAEEPPGTSVRLAFLRDGRGQAATVRLVALEHFVAPASAPGASTISGPLAGVKTGAIPPKSPEHGKVTGVYVADVAPYSNAATAGLRQGDIILDADRKPVASPTDLKNALKAHPAGRPLLLRVARNDAVAFLALE
jgi:Do/DeqQ family serine protease